jgi:predicted AlkP superfamily phosphohydrolase/phosphomutase
LAGGRRVLTSTRPPGFSRLGLKKRAFLLARAIARAVLPHSARELLKEKSDVGGRTSIKYLMPTINYAESRAFSEGTFGSICLNVRGREPMGIVEPGAEYEALRGEIRRKLEALVDPVTGVPAVEKTFLREELYSGAHFERAPDIIAVLREGYQMVGDIVAHQYGGRRPLEQTVFALSEGTRFKLSGIHRPIGIVMAAGPSVKPGARIEGARIIDIAPTVLQLFGLHGPPMDGQVLQEIVAQKPTPVTA